MDASAALYVLVSSKATMFRRSGLAPRAAPKRYPVARPWGGVRDYGFTPWAGIKTR